jgi:hypothetical protein
LGLSFVVPGLGFFLRGGRKLGLAACGVCLCLALVFVIFLGYPIANITSGLLISIHVSSIIYLLEPWLQSERLRTRIAVSLTTMLAVTTLLYLPLQHFIDEHWLRPLRLDDRVIVVRRHANLNALRRGDWIAYSFREDNRDRVFLHGGSDMARIIGLPGDEIIFKEGYFTVNGIAQTSSPYMPASGEWSVPKKYCFVWPGVAITRNRGVMKEAVSSMLLTIGKVPDDQMIGTPFRRWFWRQQLP